MTQLQRPTKLIPAPNASALLKVEFLGGLRLSQNDQLLPCPQSRTARALLAFLILNADFVHTRAALCERFWFNLPERQARGRLTKALSLIRQCFEGFELVQTDSDAVRFHTAVRVETDLRVLQKALQTNTGLEFRLAALKAYRGDFLADLDNDWVLESRVLYRDQYAALLERSMRESRSQGDPERALEFAQMLVRFDPLREDAHIEVMQIQLFKNQPRAVLKQFERCKKALLDVSDKPGMEACAVLRQAQLQLGGGARSSSASLLSTTELPLVARETELKTLLEALERAQAGQGGVVILSGEAGIGKTRLLQEFMRQATWRGVRSMFCKGNESASAAYESLRDLLETGLTPLRLERLTKLLEPIWLEEVARIAPKIALQSGIRVNDTEPDPLKLREAISRTLLGLSEIEPHLIVLEDLQWMDEASLEYLPLLAKRLQTNRLLLLVSHRSDEQSLNPAPKKSLRALEGTGAKTITLSRLTAQDTARLIRASLGTLLAANTLEANVHGSTEGNPLFVLETLREMHAKSAITLGKNGIWQLEPNHYQSEGVVQDMIRARLKRLGQTAQNILSAAAVLEANFDLETLAFVCAISEAEVLEQLLPLVQNGLLLETGRGLGFAHDRMREVAYLETPETERTGLHGRAAEILEQNAPEAFERLALHFERAQVWEKAIDYSAKAAEHAKEFGAPSITITHCDHLEQMLDKHPLPNRKQMLELMLNLLRHREHALWAVGDTDRIPNDLKQLDLIAQELQEPIAIIAALEAKSLFLARFSGKLIEAMEYILQAVEIAKDNNLHKKHGDTLFRLGQIQTMNNQLTEAIQSFQECLSIYRDLPECLLLQAETYVRIAATFRELGKLELAKESLQKALSFNLHQTRPRFMAKLYREMGNIEFFIGNYNESLASLSVALSISEKLNDDYLITLCINSIILISQVSGNFDKSVVYANKQLFIVESYSKKTDFVNALHDLACILVNIGNYDLADSLISKAIKLSKEIGGYFFDPLKCLQNNFFIETDRIKLVNIKKLTKIALESEINTVTRELLVIVAKAKFSLGKFEESLSLYLDVTQRFEIDHDPAASCHTEIANNYLHLGNLEQALEYSQKAVEILGQFRGLLSQKVHFHHHQILLAVGQTTEARAALKTAFEIVQTQCATLPEAKQRRDFLQNVRVNREIVAAFGILEPIIITRHETLRLPPVTISSGNVLKTSDYLNITWTVQDPSDQGFLNKAEARQHRLERLLTEAAQQGAAPTVNDLANALAVSAPTIKRDLASARKRGKGLKTRGVREMS